ncbi:MAG: T9SS type A sorting domain-containing protein [Crocinitomicaceae bacterium]|nr:T9SS type A sorting domain-containing protein [Crocinitomicaceae bacterium]
MKKVCILLLSIIYSINYVNAQNCSISLKENNTKFCSNDSMIIKSILSETVAIENYYVKDTVLKMSNIFTKPEDAQSYKAVIASGVLLNKDINQIASMLSQQPFNIVLNNISNISGSVDLKITNTQNLNKVLVSSGKLILTIYTDLTQETYLDIEFPNIKKNGQLLKVNIKINADLSASLNKPFITTIDLSNTIIDLAADGGKLKYIVKPNLIIKNTTTSAQEKVIMEIQTSDFKFSSGYTYKWFKNQETTPIATDISSLVTKEAGTYKVIVTSTGLCPELTDEITITKITMPSKKLNIASDNKICQGDTLTIKSSEPLSYAFLWSDEITKTSTLKATKTGYYSVKITNDICSTQSDTIKLVVNPKPLIKLNKKDTTIVIGNQLTIIATGAKAFLWSTKSDKDTITVKEAGIYSVTGTNEFGCTSSASIKLDLREKGVGLATINGLAFKVSPNPTSDLLHITMDEFKNKAITLADLNGKIVYTQTLTTENTTIVVDSFSKGVYLLNIIDGANTALKSQRIVIE